MSWPMGVVSDIAEVISGFAFKSEWFGTGDAKVIRIGDLKNGRIDLAGAEKFDDDVNKIREQFRIKRGDILMALSGATVGKIAVADADAEGAYLNQRVAVVRGKCQENAEYLKYVFSGSSLQKLLLNAGGAAQPNLSPKDLAGMEIPLPPLPEQKRIAAILDKADAIRRKRQQAIQLADDFLRAVFLDMFGDPVTNPKGWEMRKWCNVLKIVNGKNQKAVEDEAGAYPICGSGGFMAKANNWLTEANSVIIGRKGNINSPILMRERFWNVDTAFGLEPKREALSHNYLFWFCKFFDFEQLNKAVTIPSLTKTDLLQIDIPLPPRDVQGKFDEVVERIDMLSAKNEKTLSEQLFESLSQKAFSGQL